MKILIVEDNVKLSSSLKRGLEHEGYVVDCLSDGETGQKRIESDSTEYDLIILDVMLPKRDGITVCKNLRDRHIVVPILMLTAKDTTEDKILGLDSGADDYLVKPFSFEELLARMRALLRRPKNVLPQKLQVKDIVLDTATRQVFRQGKEINLTLKEFMVLEYLMRHPNQVLTREQLLDHAWDFSFDSLSNVVDVHIKNLRKKIATNRHDNLLETIRGVGYRLKG